MTGEEIRIRVQDITGGKVIFIDEDLFWMFQREGIKRGWFSSMLEPYDINSMEALDEINTIAMCLLDPTNSTANDNDRVYYAEKNNRKRTS